MGCAMEEKPQSWCTYSYLDNFRRMSFDRNVYFNETGSVSTSFPQAGDNHRGHVRGQAAFTDWQEAGQDKNSRIDLDPEFKKGTFVVTSAQVRNLGIMPLQIDNVGPSGWQPDL